MQQCDDFAASAYHLTFLSASIEDMFKALKKIYIDLHGFKGESSIFSLYAMILISTCSFLDEYHDFLKSEDENFRGFIIDFKSVVKPAVKEIENWTGLRRFRNEVLAHNFRKPKKGNKSIFIPSNEVYDIPLSLEDLYVLVGCIKSIVDVLKAVFPYEINRFSSIVKNDSSLFKPGKYDAESYKIRHNAICRQVKSNFELVIKRYSNKALKKPPQ